MKTFHFPLETPLRLRMQVRDERRRQLTQAYEAQRLLEQQQAELAQEQLHVQQHGRSASEPGELNVDRLLGQHRYALLLQARQQVMKQQKTALADETERRRQALSEADTEVRTIERLRERRLADHQLSENRREQREADDITVTHWNAGNKR